ncbi:nuclear pore complex protein DDB_G0274915-like [Diprion similis]|uniref:nuclear pore complex protein DDB_G0274915-like n=1 Tax=Diprion similis TaxID=362088 RepID=UPI001EF97A59|nr:nuclear pore complex protein DDB_G0274915-like [Diprion similis]
MWDLGDRNRGIFVLISVLSGCAVLYNAWGPILALTVSIIVVIYVCYSLLTNDSILSPQALFFLEYVREGGREISANLNVASFYLSSTLRKLYTILNSHCWTYVASKMSRFRKNSSYQLSNDNRQASRSSSRFDLTTNALSPIPKNNYQENTPYIDRLATRQPGDNYPLTKLTSTPLDPWCKDTEAPSNGGIGLFTPARPLRREAQPTFGPSHSSMIQNETVFSPEGSPWGTSISPKMRSKAAGIKTVQTVAGPLLASTRYNIDPKTYSDVTSPGLSTRLARYATEANSKLTHQSQYATGQFPKVNLSVSPLPLINMKNAKVRTPVTVRIAPPDTSRYSPPERQRVIADICKAENRGPQSVVQVLREISLKRHASRDDVSLDLAKKQRTESIYEDNLDDLEEMTQKRSREDSPNSEEEEDLLRNNQLRPVKKTKTPSCYDVLNSLSSSNQYSSSGVKRKASTLDLSRSGTPDIEKHFKPSDTIQGTPKLLVTVTEPETEKRKPQRDDLNLKSSLNMEVDLSKKSQEQSPIQVKGILKNVSTKDTIEDQSQGQSEGAGKKMEENTETEPTKNLSPAVNKSINFTEKLFMKAEPQANERLRTLIEEQGNIRAKFTTDDVDEIKKEDIVNMRQTSMRARLQSMFDAISGKSAKKINPDVIIQADSNNEPSTTSDAPSSSATLSLTTSTTGITTTPITTSAVVSTAANSKVGNTTKIKNVTFDLPSSQQPLILNSSLTSTISSTGFQANTTEAQSQSEIPKLNFGTVATTTTNTTATDPAKVSSPNNQNTSTMSTPASSAITSTIAPPSFAVGTTSTQGSTVSSGIQSGSNLTSSTTLATKVLPPSSIGVFSSSNYTNVTQSTNIMLGSEPLMTSLSPSTGKFVHEPIKSVDTVKTNTQTPTPMPNFSFGATKMTPSSAFGGNNQFSASTQNQANISTSTPATTSAFVPSIAAQTQQSATKVTSMAGSITVPETKPAVFSFDGNSAMPQSTSSGSFLFAGNTSTTMSQAPTFGIITNQSTLTFGNTATTTQNPPAYGSSVNFQSVQAPGVSVASTTSQNAATFSSNPPAFGSVVTTAAQNVPPFGTVASSAPPPAYGINTPTTSSTFAFGNAAAQTTAASAFSTNVKSTTPSTASTLGKNPTFSFGSTSAPSTKPGFSFSANAAPTTTSSEAVTAGNTVRVPAYTIPNSRCAPLFGAPATTAPPVFGAPSSTAPPAFGGTSSTTMTAFGATANTTTPLFGSPATTTSGMFNTGANQSTFGTVSNSAATPSAFSVPKTTAPPAFGSHTTDTGFNYGGKAVQFTGTGLTTTPSTAAATGSAVTSTATSAFGANTEQKNIFGQAKSPPSFAASTSQTFGNSGTPSFGTSNTSFGGAANTASGNNSVFGAQTSMAPAFGTQTPAVKQTSQAPPPAFGSVNTSFGASATPSTGFGSSAATFGTQNTTTPNFGAGTASSGSTFGTNVPTPFGQGQKPPPAFGTQNSTTPSFGSTNNNTSGGFGFNSSQQQTQQNSSFSFSGNATANSTMAAAPFQFGGAPAKTDGFNFNAPTTVPNLSFGANASSSFGGPTQGSNMFGAATPAVPASGMFSIGAGSTAPRSRSNRTRSRR